MLVAHSIHHQFGAGRAGGGGVLALENISARAERGRVVAVIGPNAAGKSTLLRCLAGVLRPSQGAVLLDEEDVGRMAIAARAARIAFVPQRPTVAAAFCVREVVALGRYAQPPEPRRLREALEAWDLVPLADRSFHSLSAGQQHRVALARAAAQLAPAGCLVLDEPTAAMDLSHARSTVAHLRDVAATGAVVIVSTHDLSLASVLADDIWMLSSGRLVGAGPASALLTPERLEPVFGVPFVRVMAGTTAQVTPLLRGDADTIASRG